MLSILGASAEGSEVAVAKQRAELRRLQQTLDELAATRAKRRRGRVPALSELAEGRQRSHDLRAQAAARLRSMAETEAARAGGAAARARVVTEWSDRAAIWAAIEEAFGPLGALLGLGWDLSRAILQSKGWKEIERLRRLLGTLPELKDVVRTLGRLQAGDDAATPPIVEQILGPVRRASDELRELRVPDVPHDLRGLERSASIERMLPSEAALLSHPQLKMLWHARRAEHALLGYRVEGVYAERARCERDELEQQQVRRPPTSRGPILVCLDTSGSMAGLPEHVAKALVLETMRVAHAERRACYLYLFGGEGDVLELELRPDPDGLTSLVHFLQASFHGGTDVAGPLRRAIARLAQGQWERADILLVTDGEFPEDAALEAAVRAARSDRGVRVHGALVASPHSAALERLCEPLHAFSGWEVMAGSAR